MEADTKAHLRAIPLFSGLDDDTLERVAELATAFEVRPGHVLIENSQAGTGLFIIQEGNVRVELPGEAKVELGPGSFIGEMSLLADVPRTARVVATSEVRGLAIHRAALMGLLEADASLAVAMLREVTRRFAELESHHP